MLFDKMCMIAEHHHQTLVPVLREARLFHLPVKAHEVIPKEFTKAEAEFLAETFFLPFPITVRVRSGYKRRTKQTTKF